MEKQIKVDKIVSDEEQIKTFRRVCLGLQKEAQAQWTRFPKIDYLPQVPNLGPQMRTEIYSRNSSQVDLGKHNFFTYS